MNRLFFATGFLCISGLLTAGRVFAAGHSSSRVRAQNVSLRLGAFSAASSLPAVEDASGEVYAPALDDINATFGCSLVYLPGRSVVTGMAADGTEITLTVSATREDAIAGDNAYVAGQQVFVPLRALSRLMGDAFEFKRDSQEVTVMPRLSSVSVVPMANRVRIELHGSAPLGYVRVSYYDNPWRIVLDVNGIRASPGRQASNVPGLKEIRWKEWPSKGHVRIVAQLSDHFPYTTVPTNRSCDYWMDVSLAPGASVDPGSITADAGGNSPPGDPATTEPNVPVTPPGGSEQGGTTGAPTATGSIEGAPSAGAAPAGGLAPAPVNVIPIENAAGVSSSGQPASTAAANRAPAPAPAPAATDNTAPAAIKAITSRRVGAHSTELTISGTGPLACRASFYDSPSRLVLDVPNSSLKMLTPDLWLRSPGVKEVRTGNFPKGSPNSRIVVDLTSRSMLKAWSEQDRSIIRVLVKELGTPASGGRGTISPVAGHTICIDPGHCGVFHGCRGNGLKEEDVCLDVARRLQALLTAAGAQVVMTHDTLEAPSAESRSVARDILAGRTSSHGMSGLLLDLITRAAIANRAHADLFLSIHCNATWPHGTGHGAQVVYSRPGSYHWASIVYQDVCSVMDNRHDGMHFRPQIKVTEYTDMPAVLAELGYLDTHADAELLWQPSFREKEAEGLFHAFETYFREEGGPAETPAAPDTTPPDSTAPTIPAPASPGEGTTTPAAASQGAAAGG